MKEYSLKMAGKKQPTPSEVSFASTKTSRRSHSAGPRSRSKGKKVKPVRGIKAKMLKAKAIKTLGPIVQSLNSATKKLALSKANFFDAKDTKTDIPQMQKEVDQLQKELSLALGAVRAGLGDRPIRMRLSAPFTITTTVTTGVTNTVLLAASNSAINPSYCSEWSTLAVLFEEYKMMGGEAEFAYINPSNNNVTVSMIPNNIPIMAYDADDPTVASASILLTQTAQHRVLRPGGNGSITPALSNVPAEGMMHTFRFHIPRGDVDPETIGGLPVAAGTQWNPIAQPLNHGFLKFYHVGQCITANDTGAGWVYMDLEFRCRA